MKTFVIMQRTGFCHYFWTGHSFAAKFVQAKTWRTQADANYALKKLKRLSPAYEGCVVEERHAETAFG